MEDIDDDFGELYADVELQPASEINGVSNIALQQTKQQPQQHNDEVRVDGKRESENGYVEEAEKRESDSETSNNGGDKLELEDESYSDESDDDFDVVVNDEDIGPKSGGGDGRKCGEEVVEGVEAENVAEVREGSLVGKSRMRVDSDGLKQSGGGGGCGGKSPYKYIRRDGPANVENQRALCSWKADREDVWYGQARMSGFAPGFAGNGSSFWLPWYRTIVDVDIDMFEQKSWTHPEADITDYFNFGFDEESWRNYCRSLGKLRRQTLSQTRNQGNEVGATKDQKSGRFVNAEPMSLPSGCRNISSQESEFVTRQLIKQIGQAIHVEDSKFERQSSADARRPRNLDSDVVIQITGQDSEDHFGSGKEERDNNPEIQCDMPEKGLGHGNVEQDDKLGGFKACEMGKTFVERPFQSSSLSSDCKRSCESASHMLQDSIGQGKDQKSDIDVQHSEKVNTFSEENPRVIQTLNSSTEDVNTGRDTTETDPSVAGIDLSFEDHGYSCLSPSYNAGSEMSKDDDYNNLRTRDLRRSSSASTKERHHGTKVDHLCLRSERDHRKVKQSGGRYHLRVKSSPNEGLRHNEQRIQRHLELNNHTDDSVNCQIGIAEHRYGVGRSRSRHRGREEFRLASPDDEHWLHYRKNKPSIGRYARRSVEDRLQPEHMRTFDRQDHWRAKDEVDLVYLREWGEEQFLSDKRMQRVRGLTTKKDRCLQERERMIRDEKPVFQSQENFMLKHSSSHDVDLFKQRTEYDDGVHFPKRSKKGQLSQFQYSGRPVLKRFGKHNLLDRQQIEQKYSDSEIKYERQLWHSGREVEPSGGVDEYFESPLDVDCPWYTVDDDEYWNGKPNHLDRHHMYLDSEIKHERWLWHSGREVGTFGRGNEYFESTLGVDYRRYSVDDEDYWNGQTSISIHDDRDGLPSFGELRHQNTLYRDDTDCPRLYQSYERRRKSISAKKGIVSTQIYDHRDACNRQDVSKYLDEDDYFENERIIFQSKGSWNEDTLFDGGYDKDSYDENMLDSLNGTPRHKWTGSRHGFVPGGMAKQTKKMKGRFKVSSDSGGKSYTMMPKKTKHDENGLWGRNSVALRHTVKERKTLQSPGKFSKAGTVPNNDACQHAVGKFWEQPKRKQEQDKGRGKTMENKVQNNEVIRSKLPVTDHSKAADLELEEGQIPTEVQPSTVVMKVKKSGLGHVAQKDTVKGGLVNHVYDEKRILETMAKMEKRKERFKEPIHAKKDMDFDPQSEADNLVATAETKGQKPARKRKWG